MRIRLAFWRTGRSKGSDEPGRSVIGNPAAAPRCSHLRRGAPIPGTMRFTSIRCEHPAVVKVLSSHGGGDGPVYHERCIGHAWSHLSPFVAATWNPTRGGWEERDIDPRGWWR